MFPTTSHTIVLQSLDPRANRARRYVLVLTIDANEDMPYSVSSQWGRDGWFMRDLSIHAEDMEAALAQMRATLRRRRAHGYVVTEVSAGNPLARWLRENDMPVERIPDNQPRLFPLPTDTPADPMQGRLFAN
jgi:hypothetical protein